MIILKVRTQARRFNLTFATIIVRYFVRKSLFSSCQLLSLAPLKMHGPILANHDDVLFS